MARYGVGIAFLMNGLSFLGVIAALLDLFGRVDPEDILLSEGGRILDRVVKAQAFGTAEP